MTGTRSGVAAAAAAPTAPTPPDFTVLNQYAVNLNPGAHEAMKLLREFTNSKFADDEDKKSNHRTHDEWKERKNQYNRRDKRDKDGSGSQNASSTSGRLQVQQKLKSVLTTKKGMTQKEAQEVLRDLEN